MIYRLNKKISYAIVIGLGIFNGIYTQQQDRIAAQEIIKSALSDSKKGGYTQTEALMSFDYIQKKIEQSSQVASIKQIFLNALAKEREMNKDYYVFYTAVPHTRVFQDVMRKLYQLKVGKIGALQDKAFQFVRYAYKDPVYNTYNNVSDFLIKEFQKNGIVNDHNLDIITILLSTNLAFWGNIDSPPESTFFYLLHTQIWSKPKRAWLEQAFTSLGYSLNSTKKLIDELMELSTSVQEMKPSVGDLFQIFVPKKLIDQLGYLAWRMGIPFDVPFIQAVFSDPDLSFKPTGPHSVESERFEPEFDAFTTKWHEKDPQAVTWVNKMIENIRSGKYYLSSFLNQYETNPQSIKDIGYHQARLLITNDGLLNPASGLKIYRYSLLNKEQEAKYKAALKNILKPLADQKKTQP
jgi:hypothetical protein